MNIFRKFKREQLKKEVGSNRINPAWRAKQIKKFGENAWLNQYIKCKKFIYKDSIYLALNLK